MGFLAICSDLPTYPSLLEGLTSIVLYLLPHQYFGSDIVTAISYNGTYRVPYAIYYELNLQAYTIYMYHYVLLYKMFSKFIYIENHNHSMVMV